MEEGKISTEPREEDSLSTRTRQAMQHLLPLFDKLPHNVLFAEDVMTSIKSPSFTAYCESQQKSPPQYMPASVVLSHLEAFLHTSPDPPSKGQFKRPLGLGTKSSWSDAAKKVKVEVTSNGLASALSSADDLKSRLQAKLQNFRAKRKAVTLDAGEASQLRDLRKKLNKLKKKEKAKKKKAGDKTQNGQAEGSGAKVGVPATNSSSRSSSVVSEEGKMIFSRFDFFDHNGATPHAAQPAGKNLHHLLNRAEAQKKKLDKTDAEGREKKAWQEALLKAQGVKLKNDPAKLKQAIKQQAKRKDKSKKQWDERKQNIQSEKKQRQDKRQKNLQARQDTKKNNKRKKLIKKGHIIPGFN
ncbi:hypothetical protein RvY_17076 [Ramazzottius varieornatus]|uniref:Ribosomal RNA-processing protein 14/surfeit locus protein 6 C-terminal domain-containing protein n=1 Tax=Ramazzottius varieornatus TaxID=947166 RepID=A0A1D1W1R6_RAMVA|nr:hypothetical protein RvY_17076 [Ramazzottius varieornatus]